MRSQAIFRRSRSLFSLKAVRPASHLGKRLLRTSKTRLPPGHLTSKYLSSLTPGSPAVEPPFVPPEGPSEPLGGPSEPCGEEAEKPRTRRSKISLSVTQEPEPLELPDDLGILWTPSVEPSGVRADPDVLPPPDILEEALNDLHVTLHPHTQHRATYASGSSAVEPTLALYCPIEGGDYVIDATVQELARRTGAEVLVLDAVQLAAGEWGHFGKAANSLQLPRNPLQLPSSPIMAAPSGSRSVMVDDNDEFDMSSQFLPTPQMSFTLMTPMSSRTIVPSTHRRSNGSAPSKVKVFFDSLVNLPSKHTDQSESTSSSLSRPRLIYVRDFQTLASSSATWYPPLLSAVRQRRRGPISRPSSPIPNPMTIIFGVTPSLTPPLSPSHAGPSSGLMSLLMNRSVSASHITSPPRPTKSDWSEDDVSEKAREKRLLDRLRKWEIGDIALQEDIPHLQTNPEESDSSDQKPNVVVLGRNSGMPPLPLPPALAGLIGSSRDSREKDAETGFFRLSIVVPRVRAPLIERVVRMARRREINELSMRMAIGAVGGSLESGSAPHESVEGISTEENLTDSALHAEQQKMWDDWGKRIETWSNVRNIADHAVGSTVKDILPGPNMPTLEPTIIPWQAVHRAWSHYRNSRDRRKSWSKEASPGVTRDQDEGEVFENTMENTVDEVAERIKQDPDLDPHEQRLLPSIVDPGKFASMSTSFSQVHLPTQTIDAVRTIVSLPLLHPAAFQQGILREHGMTGCLLFGPPGTGKTLVVRALAKEAGCRMMVISPSDVMDMYVGEGEKLVKAVFSLARRLSPCVVFLDEIDALFGARMSARESGSAFAHRGVITEFMQEMDGLKSNRENRVIVIGATNRPFDLDDAVLRRLPRRLLVDLPGEKEREEILKILLRDEVLAPDVDVRSLAKRTDSFSGSDLKHLCVSAALDAVKERVEVPWVLTQPSVVAAKSTSVGDAASMQRSTTSSATITASEPGTVVPESSKPHLATAPTTQAPEDSLQSSPAIRVLHLRNFSKALREITPSSSEALGSLADLRKWDEEFGEGRKNRKKVHVWGKDRFGFTDRDLDSGDGRVSATTRPDVSSSIDTSRTDQ